MTLGLTPYFLSGGLFEYIAHEAWGVKFERQVAAALKVVGNE